MTDLIVGIGLVFVIEGLLYAAFPATMRRMVEQMAELADSNLRTVGMMAIAIGVGIVWLVRG